VTALLSVEELSLGFATEGGFASVLDRVSLSIDRGRVLGLVGESGCGKTTLARAILGVLPREQARITGGRVLFRDTDLLTADPAVVNQTVRGRAITFVPQDPFTSFNPLFTVGDQIMEILKWKSPRALSPPGPAWLPAVLARYPGDRKGADNDAVLELLDAVQLPRPKQLLRKYPHELSGGQRQRLMIAMALLPGPDLVIADEPTTALDVTIQAQILGLIRRLATERNVAVMLTTHDLGAAYEICDAVNVMYAGQDVESAPVDRFFAAPAHPYTTKLLASLPDAGGTASGIPGEVPTLIAPPGGCRFHPRCERADGPCREARPPVQQLGTGQLGAGHWVRCYHPHTQDKAP
jgi:peptide/nickel transport system ATP-binding protein